MLKFGVLLLGLLALQQAFSRFPASAPSELGAPGAAQAVHGLRHPALGSLDDPANPFAGHYDAIDTWLSEHSLGVIDTAAVLAAPQEWERYQTPFCVEAGCLTTRLEGGYPLPFHEHLRRYVQALLDGRGADYMREGPLVCARGELSPALTQQLEELLWDAQAASFPTVPDWLAAGPPLKVRLLPNGQVLALGRPGSGSGLTHGEIEQRLASGLEADLYSADGRLLESGKPELWLPLCERLDCVQLQSRGELSLTADKYLELRERSSNKLLHVWDFDGRELDASRPRLSRSLGFSWLRADELQQLYAAQQRRAAQSS